MCIVVDTAHGHAQGVLRSRGMGEAERIPRSQVIGGNIGTADGAKALVDHGADARQGRHRPGSICTTRIVAGIGVPQITAVQNVAEALANGRAADRRRRHPLFRRRREGASRPARTA